jgi:hypothetical protein
VIGVLVLLNNFFHDLSVALFACALLGAAALWRGASAAGPAARPVVEALDRTARRVAAGSFAGIVVFGAVRTAAFREYEWLPAVGRGIVPALVVKHVVLVALLAGAGWAAWRARRRGRQASGGFA